MPPLAGLFLKGEIRAVHAWTVEENERETARGYSLPGGGWPDHRLLREWFEARRSGATAYAAWRKRRIEPIERGFFHPIRTGQISRMFSWEEKYKLPYG